MTSFEDPYKYVVLISNLRRQEVICQCVRLVCLLLIMKRDLSWFSANACIQQAYLFREKVYLTPPPFILGLLHPPTMKPSVLPPELSKTVYFTPWAVSSGGLLQ